MSFWVQNNYCHNTDSVDEGEQIFFSEITLLGDSKLNPS